MGNIKQLKTETSGNARRVMPDYRIYEFSRRELIATVLTYLLLAAGLVWLFYNRWYMIVAAIPGLLPYLKQMKRKKAEERRRSLTYDFRDALDSLSVSLKAGYSVENAFPAAAHDLAAILGRDADMTKEIKWRHTNNTLYLAIEHSTSEVYSICHILNLKVLLTDICLKELH